MTARATVLAYHGVGEPPPGADVHGLFVTPARFRAQLELLAKHRQVVPLEAVVSGQLPPGKPAVALTFDDAYRHLLDEAVPLMASYGFPSTVFVPTRWVGERNTWDAPSACDLDIMSAEELRAAEQQGMAAESHGHAHIDMRTASAQEVVDDLAASRRHLRELTGRDPRFLAWPFKDGSPQAQGLARDAGFAAAFSIDQPHAGTFSWERVQVTPPDGRALFALKTSGRYMALRHSPVLDRAYRSVRGLIRR